MCKRSDATLFAPVTLSFMPSPPASSSTSDPSTEGRSAPESSSFPFTTAARRDALRQLSSVLTTQVSTLTSTISGYADLLVEAQDDQEQREIAMNVLEATTRIDDLLADLRHYSRSLEPAPRTVSVPDVARGAVRLLSDAERARVCQRVEPPAVQEIEADPRLLRQALLNLLQNALEASGDSEDILFRVADDGEAPDTAVAFEIWNDGEISLDDPTRMFQPFYSTRPQCLGLGLPITARIADQHGGTVELTENSAAAGGTCFTLRI